MNESINELSRLPRFPLRLLVIPGAVLLVQIFCKLFQPASFLFINHDVAFDLHCGESLLDGKIPYVDCIDIAPPALYYMYTIPWCISRLTSTDVVPVCLALIYLATMVSSICTLLLFRNAILPADKNEHDWLAFGPLFFAFLLFNLTITYHAGQRECAFVLAFWPFVIVRWLRWQYDSATKVNPIIAFTAGSALVYPLCAKPHLLIMPVALELYWLCARHFHRWRLRSNAVSVEADARAQSCTKAVFRFQDVVRAWFRWLCAQPELLVPVTALLVYALHFLFLPQSMLQGFLRILSVACQGYNAYTPSFEEVLSFSANNGNGTIAKLGPLVLCLVLAVPLGSRCTLIMPLVVWMLSGWLVYLWQDKGWAYHTIPLTAGYFLLANLELALISRWALTKIVALKWYLNDFGKLPYLVFLVYGTALLPLLPMLIFDSKTTGKVVAPALESKIYQTTRPGDPVLILDTNLAGYPLLVQLNRRPGCRYLFESPIRMVEYVRQNTKDAGQKDLYTAEEERMIHEIEEDIQRIRPRLIFIDAHDRAFQFYNLLAKHDFIERALLNYTFAGTIDGYAAFQIKAPPLSNSAPHGPGQPGPDQIFSPTDSRRNLL